MKKIIIFSLIAILLTTQLNAQEQDTLQLRKHAITTQPFAPLFGGTLLVTYEHALPKRSSLEMELGGQGFWWERYRGYNFGAYVRPGVVATVGYKFYLPLGKDNKNIALAGGIPQKSFFLKSRLAYIHQWSKYDVYVDNDGWDIHTQCYTLHEDDLSLAFILGYQYVSKRGFVVAPFFGFNIPLIISGPFHTCDNPGNSAVNLESITFGTKMGWAF